MTRRLLVAFFLGPVCFFMMFIAEGVDNEAVATTVAGMAMGASFFLSQYVLSHGQRRHDARNIMLALNFIPLCLGIAVVIVERKTGAWIQGVWVVALGLTCSLAAGALAGRSVRT